MILTNASYEIEYFQNYMLKNYSFNDQNILERLSLTIHELLSVIRYEITHNIYNRDSIDEMNSCKEELMSLVQKFLIDDFKEREWFTEETDRISVQSCYSDYNYLHIRFYYNGVAEETLLHDTNIFQYNKTFKQYESTAYNDSFGQAFPELFEPNERYPDRSDIFVHTFTFQTSEDCNLNCVYCYQACKSAGRMKLKVAKKCIDDLLTDKYDYINQYNSPGFIMEFIGGEPLLEMNLTRKLYEYFIDRAYELNHPWFRHHRISICSNGLLYFDSEVQKFFQDYKDRISFNISIDGNRDLHDAGRVQPNGEGSYDIDILAYSHFIETYREFNPGSKMTLAPSNIKYLFESLVTFINHGFKVIHLNCVFEEGWEIDYAKVYWTELQKVADYILENNLETINVAIFSRHRDGGPLTKLSDNNWCGGTGSMLSLDYKGIYYPCTRYMPSSVGNDREGLEIGDIHRGINTSERDQVILDGMSKTTRRSQSNDICFECPVNNGCASCSALNYQVFGTWNKRSTFHCKMHITEAIANVYYWNLLNIKKPEYEIGHYKNRVPDEWALEIISQEDLDLIKLIELRSMQSDIEHGIYERIKLKEKFSRRINCNNSCSRSCVQDCGFIGMESI